MHPSSKGKVLPKNVVENDEFSNLVPGKRKTVSVSLKISATKKRIALSKVTRLIFGRKDIVRRAVVMTAKERSNELRRPFELLYPLEACEWDSFRFLPTRFFYKNSFYKNIRVKVA